MQVREAPLSELKQRLEDTKNQLINALDMFSKQARETTRKTSKLIEEQKTLTKTKLVEEVTKIAQATDEHFTVYKNKMVEVQSDVESLLQVVTDVTEIASELQTT